MSKNRNKQRMNFTTVRRRYLYGIKMTKNLQSYPSVNKSDVRIMKNVANMRRLWNMGFFERIDWLICYMWYHMWEKQINQVLRKENKLQPRETLNTTTLSWSTKKGAKNSKCIPLKKFKKWMIPHTGYVEKCEATNNVSPVQKASKYVTNIIMSDFYLREMNNLPSRATTHPTFGGEKLEIPSLPSAGIILKGWNCTAVTGMKCVPIS